MNVYSVEKYLQGLWVTIFILVGEGDKLNDSISFTDHDYI